MDEKLKLTTVKVIDELYLDFKVINVPSGFTLQKLVNRCIYLFIHDIKFRGKIMSDTSVKDTYSQSNF